MGTNNEDIIHKELAYEVVGLGMEVHRKMGIGFLEKIYENALMVLLKKNGIAAQQQSSIKVNFEGEIVGDYCADILVDEKIILELKVAEKITDIHRAQVLNYLRATGLRLGIIFNFGKKGFEYERLVL